MGYVTLGQPATEFSRAVRPSVSNWQQNCSASLRGDTLYVIDELPPAGLHPADVDQLMRQLQVLVDAGNTVVVAEHDMRVAAQADWIIDLGPEAGDAGGTVVAAGTPADPYPPAPQPHGAIFGPAYRLGGTCCVPHHAESVLNTRIRPAVHRARISSGLWLTHRPVSR